MPRLRLIVHADDFGISDKVNEGIIAAHSHGIVTSTSLMASGAAFDQAIELVRATPTLDVGVHLTLTEEHPVSESQEISSLLNAQGRFHADPSTFVKRYFAGRISLEHVRRELDAQIRKVAAAGVRISHLDGHQHLHMVPGIRRLVGGLAGRHGIAAIRFPSERLRRYMLLKSDMWSRVLQLLMLDTFCLLAGAAGAQRADHFLGFFFGGKLTRQNLATVLEHLPPSGTCELMCHPGREDPYSRYTAWRYRWQAELDALTDPGLKEDLRGRGIELISYADLGK